MRPRTSPIILFDDVMTSSIQLRYQCINNYKDTPIVGSQMHEECTLLWVSNKNQMLHQGNLNSEGSLLYPWCSHQPTSEFAVVIIKNIFESNKQPSPQLGHNCT